MTTAGHARPLHPGPATGDGRVALLVEDPDLAELIAPGDRPLAERLVVVPGLVIERGEWDPRTVAEEPHLGVVLLDGFLTANIWLHERVTSQLAGPGDVLHETARADDAIPARLSYVAAEPARVAVLDRQFIAAARRWPELLVALHERLRAQERRLAVHAAIGKLRRVEERVLAVLWQLGERWGRMGADGVLIPLALTHEALGRLAGAERPTVSLALTRLGEAGAVHRRPDGSFVLAPASRELLAPAPRSQGAAPLGVRPVFVGATDPPDPPAPDPSSAPALAPAPPGLEPVAGIDRAALHRRIAALRESMTDRVRDVDAVIAASRAASARSRETRERLRGRREPPRHHRALDD